MLTQDPKQRIRATDILSHPFIKTRQGLPSIALPHEEAAALKANMGLVFSAVNAQAPISLAPIKGSELAKRRAKRPSKSPDEEECNL